MIYHNHCFILILIIINYSLFIMSTEEALSQVCEFQQREIDNLQRIVDEMNEKSQIEKMKVKSLKERVKELEVLNSSLQSRVSELEKTISKKELSESLDFIFSRVKAAKSVIVYDNDNDDDDDDDKSEDVDDSIDSLDWEDL